MTKTKLQIMTTEKTIENAEALWLVLNDISFHPSCLDMGWAWQVMEVLAEVHDDDRFIGWHIRTTFRRPDTTTGVIGQGFGRWEFIAGGATVSAVVKTCWVLVEMVVKHELMEAFCFKGKRVFDPHKSVDDLIAGSR